MTAFMLVLTTVPEEKKGHEMGRILVEEKLEKGSKDYLDWLGEETKG